MNIVKMKLEGIQKAHDGIVAIAEVMQELTLYQDSDLNSDGVELVAKLSKSRVTVGLAFALEILAMEANESVFQLMEHADRSEGAAS